jgi:hypothetical protein
MTALSVPHGPIDTEPLAFTTRARQHDILRDTLATALVPLGDWDEHVASWIASREWGLAATVAAWVHQAAGCDCDTAAPAPDDGPDGPCPDLCGHTRAEHREDVGCTRCTCSFTRPGGLP